MSNPRHAHHTPIATSSAAFTRLNYTATQLACARWCRTIQSPSCPSAGFPCSSAAYVWSRVLRLLAAPGRVSHPHCRWQGFRFQPEGVPRWPVPWSPNLCPKWIGVEGGIAAPSAPLLAAPAPLRARGFRSLHPLAADAGTVRFRLSCLEGWQPPGYDHSAGCHPCSSTRVPIRIASAVQRQGNWT